VRNRAYTPWYLKRYWRFCLCRLRNPHSITEGFSFLGKNVELYARKVVAIYDSVARNGTIPIAGEAWTRS